MKLNILFISGIYSQFNVTNRDTIFDFNNYRNDAEILNYILSLQLMIVNLYNSYPFNLQNSGLDAKADYPQNKESQKPPAIGIGGIYNSKVLYNGMLKIRQQSISHQNELVKMINELGSKPSNLNCKYKFLNREGRELVFLARAFHTILAESVLGIIGKTSTDGTRKLLTTMAIVQSKHVSFLSTITGREPFADAYESIISRKQTYTYMTPFVEYCPFPYKGTTFTPIIVKPYQALRGNKVYFSSARNDILFPFKSDKQEDPSTGTYQTLFCAFVYPTRQVFSVIYEKNQCIVPRDALPGLTMVYITRNKNLISISNLSSVIAGPAPLDINNSPSDAVQDTPLDLLSTVV